MKTPLNESLKEAASGNVSGAKDLRGLQEHQDDTVVWWISDVDGDIVGVSTKTSQLSHARSINICFYSITR